TTAHTKFRRAVKNGAISTPTIAATKTSSGKNAPSWSHPGINGAWICASKFISVQFSNAEVAEVVAESEGQTHTCCFFCVLRAILCVLCVGHHQPNSFNRASTVLFVNTKKKTVGRMP